ncbi:NUMOD1 domain-containing DNA-binding protein [Paracoccus sp. SY]|uniref:NUMOD1 domain-containing DNA-binding protein n=1 Tax=Paracoccus sp. SY TaxID=1330255 RepID=UPI0011AF0B21|nr:NUMOD1 domain-containing DNA-binding protein [Paracoccus sp. SY]
MSMPVPCHINGQFYPSQKAAAEALGVTPNAISNAIIHGREDNVRRFKGHKGNLNARHIPVVIFGRRYRSKLAAAKALGVNYRTFRRWLENGELGRLMIAISKKEAAHVGKSA